MNRKVILLSLAPTLAVLGLCACKAKPDDNPARFAKENRVPRFDQKAVQDVRHRFYGERGDMLSKGEAFFPDTSNAKSCDLGGDAYEELMFGGTKASWASSGAGITNAKISVIDGDCQGNILVGAGNLVVEYGYADTRGEGVTQKAWIIGDFGPDGLKEGISYHRSNDSFDPGRWTATYNTRPGFTLKFSFNTEEVRTYLTQDLGEIERSSSYLGDELVRVSRRAAGKEHGLQVVYDSGAATETCFILGDEVDRALCDGDSVTLTAEQKEALAAALEAAAAPTTSSAVASKGSSGPWPSLEGLVRPIGGGENDAAVIVGIEDYTFVSDVPGASMNARDWYRYFTKGRSIPAGNVKLLLDAAATDDGMRAAVRDMAARTRAGGTLWFVFVGHGAPAQNQKDGLLVGADAQQTARGLYGRSVAANEIISIANTGAQKNTVLVVDACFSGRTSGGELAPGLQPMLSVDYQLPKTGTLLLSAGRSDQFAGPLPRANRPAFSYLVLGSLLGWADKDGDGIVHSDEVISYTESTLSAVLTDRDQTPELTPARREPLGKSAGAPSPDVTKIVLGQ